MPLNEVVLSDGLPCQVESLGLFGEDVEPIDQKFLKPFTYLAELASGNFVEIPYSVETAEDPGEKPDPPDEGEKFTPRWYEWRDWHLYHAAQLHTQHSLEAILDYKDRMIRHVLENCIDKEDRKRVITAEDVIKIMKAALVPSLSLEDIRHAVSTTFKATFKDSNIVDYLLSIGEAGEYPLEVAFMRKWEYKALRESTLSEEEWLQLSIGERARRTVSANLDDWIKQVDTHIYLSKLKSTHEPKSTTAKEHQSEEGIQ